MPTPATAGSNTPLVGSVIPVPDHVPPGVAALKFMGEPLKHSELTGLIVASA